MRLTVGGNLRPTARANASIKCRVGDSIAAYVARMKAGNPQNVVAGVGDFTGAKPLISALFFDEPPAETLTRLALNSKRSASTSSTRARPN